MSDRRYSSDDGGAPWPRGCTAVAHYPLTTHSEFTHYSLDVHSFDSLSTSEQLVSGRSLLAARAETDLTDFNGFTALIVAAQGGHSTVVELLLHARAQVNAEHNDGFTALIAAAQNGHTKVVGCLITARLLSTHYPLTIHSLISHY